MVGSSVSSTCFRDTFEKLDDFCETVQLTCRRIDISIFENRRKWFGIILSPFFYLSSKPRVKGIPRLFKNSNATRKNNFRKFPILKNFRKSLSPDFVFTYTRARKHARSKEKEEEEEEAKIRNCSKPARKREWSGVKWYSDPFNTRSDLHSVPYELSSRLHPQPRTIKRLILGGCRAHKVLRWFGRDYPQLATDIHPSRRNPWWMTNTLVGSDSS